MVINGKLGIGAILAFNAYLLMLQAPFTMLGMIVMMGQRAAASADRIYEILDERSTISDRPGAVDLVDCRGRRGLRRRSTSPTAPTGRSSFRASTSIFGPARRWPWWAGPGPASRPSPACSPASTTCGPGRSASTATTSATSRSRACDRTSASCSTSRSCSPSPSGTTSPTATRRPTSPTSRRQRWRPGPTSSSASCPTATTRSSVNAATPFRAASASASPSPAPCWSTRRSSSSTTPPAPSTSRWSWPSTPPYEAS